MGRHLAENKVNISLTVNVCSFWTNVTSTSVRYWRIPDDAIILLIQLVKAFDLRAKIQVRVLQRSSPRIAGMYTEQVAIQCQVYRFAGSAKVSLRLGVRSTDLMGTKSAVKLSMDTSNSLHFLRPRQPLLFRLCYSWRRLRLGIWCGESNGADKPTIDASLK